METSSSDIYLRADMTEFRLMRETKTLFPWQSLLLWNDRAGRFSALRLTVFVGLLAPALWLLQLTIMGNLGSKPLTAAIHFTGDWTVRFLLLSLLVTPLRVLLHWPQLIAVRRMIGVSALMYVILHLGLYTAEQAFDIVKVVSEIIKRFYLSIGFVALLGLLALGITSTDGMVRRMGALRWNQLHRLTYAISVLGLLHFFLQSKLDVTQPVLMTGFFFWLMGYRLLRRYDVPLGPLPLIALAGVAAVLTALTEALWYGTMTGVMASRVLAANLDFEFSIRPAWWVLAAGLALALAHLARISLAPERSRRNDPEPAAAP
jgi:methionine sulfoxide reductase heme-binding subunit